MLLVINNIFQSQASLPGLPFWGSLLAQRVRHWPADLAVLSLIPAGDRNQFNRKQGSIAHALSLSPSHCTDMTKIILKRA